MHIISTDENQVFAAVQEWNQNDTYNLYISDVRGVYFTLALENVKSNRGLEGNVIIDLYEVCIHDHNEATCPLIKVKLTSWYLIEKTAAITRRNEDGAKSIERSLKAFRI